MDIDAEVIIVGAGFGGLGMAMQLKKAKTSFIILERAADLGGTWRDNIYPGCACDIPAMLYSFSFAQSANWSRIYPQQPEILAYLKRLTKRRRIDPHIRFNSELAEARFEEPSGTWMVTLTNGQVLRSRVVVAALGPLNKPNFGNIPGRERFAGPAFHSSQWDYSVDLRGKNVVVIGTGASAVQFVPEIAPEAGRLSLFQRTAPWVMPRGDARVSRLRNLTRRLAPPYAWLVRKTIYWMLEVRALGFVRNPRLLESGERLMRGFIERSISDPVLRAKVTPAYRAGCKRILLSDNYYPALQRPNVELIAQSVAEIRPHSVVAADGREVPADAIVFGTGFRATDGILPLRIFGAGGLELAHAWRDGMRAYLGTSIAGFPNLFLVIGPNTGLGHNSMIFMMEAQYRYIVNAIVHLKARNARALDVKPGVMHAFNDDLQRRMSGTIWASGCSSWYQDASGTNVALWPGFTFAYRRRTARFDPSRYLTV